jgi:hypothetical protein
MTTITECCPPIAKNPAYGQQGHTRLRTSRVQTPVMIGRQSSLWQGAALVAAYMSAR